MWRLLASPLAPLAAFSLATAAVLRAHVRVAVDPTRAEEMVLSFGRALLRVFWAEADARHRRRVPCFDRGLLAFAFLPASLVCYCVSSRGWRGGLLILLVLSGLWVAPHLVAAFLWLVLQVVRL